MKSYSSAGQAILLLGLVPVYGAFASRVNRVRLVNWVTLFFASNLVLFVLAVRLHVGVVYFLWVGIFTPHFLWVGIFNLMAVAQFWAFANDIYTKEQGQRLFPLIGVGSSLGAWVGALRAGDLVGTSGPTRLLDRRRRRARGLRVPRPTGRPGDQARGIGRGGGGRRQAAWKGGRLRADSQGPVPDADCAADGAAEHRQHLRRVPSSAATSSSSRTRCSGRAPTRRRPARNLSARQYSRLFGTVNLVGFLLQMFVVSRVFKFLGVGKALFIHPLVALCGYLMMLRAPSVQLPRRRCR